MTMLKTLLVDDEPIALEKLRQYAGRMPRLVVAGVCEDAVQAREILQREGAELIVTDINMPDLSGLDFVKGLDDAPMVIFTTAYSQYAVEGFRVSAVDYLLKPYGFDEFSRAVDKAVALYDLRAAAARQSKGEPTEIYIKADYRQVRVVLNDILYIKGCGEYLQLFCQGRRAPLMTLSSFAAIKAALPAYFVQTHRSYVANMRRAQQVGRGRIILDTGDEVPVGDSYRPAVQEYVCRQKA